MSRKQAGFTSQYEPKGLPNAVYDITALEDIVTPDGTSGRKPEKWWIP